MMMMLLSLSLSLLREETTGDSTSLIQLQLTKQSSRLMMPAL
jgi:hypothetical protein